MKLLKKAWLFYKLAEDDEAQAIKKQYDDFIASLSTSSATIPTLTQIMRFINNFHDLPYFKVEDLEEAVYNLYIQFTSGNDNKYATLYTMNRTLRSEGSPKAITSHLMSYIVRRLLNEYKLKEAKEYIDLERVRGEISVDVMEEAQRRIILHLLRLSRSDDADAQQQLHDDWLELRRNSAKFPSQWLDELSKKFGPDFYATVMSFQDALIANRDRISNLRDKKEVLDIYDVAYLLGKHREFTGEQMQSIIQRATDEAKKYMRRFLWSDRYIDNVNEFWKAPHFMLDEEMMPMDLNYKNINWPEHIRAYRLSQEITGPEKEAWSKLFNEFQVIPL